MRSVLARKSLVIVLTGLLAAVLPLAAHAVERIVFEENAGHEEISLAVSTPSMAVIDYRMQSLTLDEVEFGGETFTSLSLSGLALPNDEGAPNLPGFGRTIAIPVGSTPRLEVITRGTRVISGVDILPAPDIPLESSDEPLRYVKDPAIYEQDAPYPTEPIRLSDPMRMRGVDVVTVGVTPFEYNPVTRELTVYTDVSVRVSFEGGTGIFGDERLRSRHWEPILRANLVNYDQLPEVEFRTPNTRDTEYEYVIVCPDDPVYTAWADSLVAWRTYQGIDTGVVTLTETGATSASIEAWVNNAYNTWATPPAAILFLGDYVSNGGTTGITSPIYGSYCISDNIYADVDGDHLPDIVTARMTARTALELRQLVLKAIEYERDPPTNPGFYQNPIMACGWQTERWFTICTEIVYGFLANEHGKTPVREYAIYSGTPGTVWSTSENTDMLVDYFGPNGLGYIPATPAHLTDWGGNATRLNSDINSGAFILQHRDHGSTSGWGEPDYGIDDLASLTNDDHTFVFSINCLTGQFDLSGSCFAEAFHRMEHGALGLIAATQSSYSFVNDAYVFGTYDCMWPEFDPGYPSKQRETGPEDLRPAFANASGKYYLQASSWPWNTGDKEVTYYLFHMHGDAFTTLYSEVPQALTVTHDAAMTIGVPSFVVTADAGSVIALTVDGEIIGTAYGTGSPLSVPIEPQTVPGTMRVTVTKTNHYRYSSDVAIIPPSGAYCIHESETLDDDAVGGSNGNDDGLAGAGETIEFVIQLENVGVDTAYGVSAVLRSQSEYATIVDSLSGYGDIPDGATAPSQLSYVVTIDPSCPDGQSVGFEVEAFDGVDVWQSYFSVPVVAPVLSIYDVLADDSPGGGNGNGCLEAGETVGITVEVANDGSVRSPSISATLSSADPYVIVHEAGAGLPFLNAGTHAPLGDDFVVAILPGCPDYYVIDFDLTVTDGWGYSVVEAFSLMTGGGNFADDIESGEGNWTHTNATTGFIDQWHIETNRYNSAGHSWKFGGTGSNVYGNSADGVLVMPTVCVGNDAEFSFWHWLAAEEEDATWAWDGCLVEYSIDDGATWLTLTPDGGYSHLKNDNPANPLPQGTPCWSGSFSWREETFDLSAFAGESMSIRFRFASDGYVTEEGWYVDDIAFTSSGGSATSVDEPDGLPARFALGQNVPNPFNPVTVVSYAVPERAHVLIEVYSVAGRLVRTLVDGEQDPGVMSVVWDGTDDAGRRTASGVYFCRMRSERFDDAVKMVLLK